MTNYTLHTIVCVSQSIHSVPVLAFSRISLALSFHIESYSVGQAKGVGIREWVLVRERA